MCEELENSWFNQAASHLYSFSLHARQQLFLDYHSSDCFTDIPGTDFTSSSLQ